MSWFKEGERGLAMSIRQTAVPLGGGIGAALLPWLASRHGFASVFTVLAAMCALSAVCALRWLHKPTLAAEPARRAQTGGTARGPLADVDVWRVALGIGILCVPQFAILTFATVFLHDFAHVGTAGTSAAMAAVQIGAMVLRVWSGRHTDRHRNRRAYLRGSTLVAAAGFFALALAVLPRHGVPAAVVLAMIVAVGIAVSAWHGVAYAELATLAGPTRAGTALGMANTVVYAGLFIAPAAIPHLFAASSWVGVWLAGGVVALVALPLFPRPEQARG
jgi:predicted MFS family arabinose efflux permease